MKELKILPKNNNIIPDQHQTLEENKKNNFDHKSEASNEFGLSSIEILNLEISKENSLRKL